MNNVQLLGRLVRDIEVKDLGTTKVAHFTLAVQRQFVDKVSGKREADFINCTAFGKSAEVLAQYVNKGEQLAVVGRLQLGSYTKDDGTKVYTTEVVVSSFTFVSQGSQGSQGSVSRGTQQNNTVSQFDSVNTFDVSDDMLPF